MQHKICVNETSNEITYRRQKQLQLENTVVQTVLRIQNTSEMHGQTLSRIVV